MEQELNTIYEAQKIDLKIIEKERVLFSTPNVIKGMENELEATRMKVQKEKEIVEELEKERKKKEKELESDKDKVKKLEAKLYEVKTNKEYQALLKEIESAKAANDKTEEDILVLMDKAEDIKKDHDSAMKHLQIREKEVQTEKGKIEKDIESIDMIISQLKTERDNLLSVVNEELRATYMVLREKRNGVAVSTAKNGVCHGCFMNIPPQLFIEVTKNRQLIQCPSCGRILFFIPNE